MNSNSQILTDLVMADQNVKIVKEKQKNKHALNWSYNDSFLY